MIPELTKIVREVLRHELATGGQTTKRGVGAAAWAKVEQRGGADSVGIGRAAVIMACMHYINAETNRQLRSYVTESEARGNFSKELVKLLGRVPRWLSVTDGPDVLWVHWSKATPTDWRANSLLKRKKANQTLAAARSSAVIAEYMEKRGIEKLEQLFGEGKKREAA